MIVGDFTKMYSRGFFSMKSKSSDFSLFGRYYKGGVGSLSPFFILYIDRRIYFKKFKRVSLSIFSEEFVKDVLEYSDDLSGEKLDKSMFSAYELEFDVFKFFIDKWNGEKKCISENSEDGENVIYLDNGREFFDNRTWDCCISTTVLKFSE